jgi:hypothetical protein
MIRHSHRDGRAYFENKIAEGKTRKEALRTLKRQFSDAIHIRLRADADRRMPAEANGREGNRGTALSPARPAHTPGTGSSDKPLPTSTQPRPGVPARRAVAAAPFKNSRRRTLQERGLRYGRSWSPAWPQERARKVVLFLNALYELVLQMIARYFALGHEMPE